jgi:predicted ATPase
MNEVPKEVPQEVPISRNIEADRLERKLIATRWCVVTGAPCSGKTTVLMAMEQIGFTWIPEVARVYIDQELAKGLTIDEIRRDEAAFQRGLVATKARIESELIPHDTVFFDRALPDSITYFRAVGLDPQEVVDISNNFRYFRVFIFDRLIFEQDGARIESEETMQFLDKQLELDYRNLGYEVIRVPVMPVEDRVQLILSSIGQET